jgi:hypothetical protein
MFGSRRYCTGNEVDRKDNLPDWVERGPLCDMVGSLETVCGREVELQRFGCVIRRNIIRV